ncbi:MAG: hypothetical protein R3A51_17895 [Nannocystaceae bacterium]|nr:hypothetical protein [Myxococcales bacterium]
MRRREEPLERLEAVVVSPRDRASLPWPLTEAPAPFVRLSASTAREDVALVVGQLALYNGLEEDIADNESPAEVIARALAIDELVLPGGLRAIGRTVEIAPSCCCGLEAWREWYQLSPWLGHDPTPWIEVDGEAVRVWSDGGLGESARGELRCLTSTRARLFEHVAAVERDLVDFLERLRGWTTTIAPAQAAALVDRFAHAFAVRPETTADAT